MPLPPYIKEVTMAYTRDSGKDKKTNKSSQNTWFGNISNALGQSIANPKAAAQPQSQVTTFAPQPPIAVPGATAAVGSTNSRTAASNSVTPPRLRVLRPNPQRHKNLPHKWTKLCPCTKNRQPQPGNSPIRPAEKKTLWKKSWLQTILPAQK